MSEPPENSGESTWSSGLFQEQKAAEPVHLCSPGKDSRSKEIG